MQTWLVLNGLFPFAARRDSGPCRRRLHAVAVFLAGVLISSALLATLRAQDPQKGAKGATKSPWAHAHYVTQKGAVTALAIAPDGKTFATGSMHAKQTTVHVWDTATGKELKVIEGHGEALKYTPKGDLLAIGKQGKVVLWDVEKAKPLRTLDGFTGFVWAVDISADGRLLAACDQQTVLVFDLHTGKLVLADNQLSKSVFAVALSGDGSRLAIGWNDEVSQTDPSEIVLWDVGKQELLQRWRQDAGQTTALTFIDKTLIASAGLARQKRGLKGGAFLWKAPAGKRLDLVPLSAWEMRALAVLGKDRLLAAGSDDDTVYVWDYTSRALRQTIRTRMGGVWTLAFSPDGRYLVIGGEDGRAEVLLRK